MRAVESAPPENAQVTGVPAAGNVHRDRRLANSDRSRHPPGQETQSDDLVRRPGQVYAVGRTQLFAWWRRSGYRCAVTFLR